MCCNNSSRSSCGCGCGCRRPMPVSCGCGCGCGCGGATTLPSFPDWPMCGCRQEPEMEMEFPVYISMPATMARGTANFSASVERSEGGCGCARG